MYSLANTQQIRMGAGRFLAASQEMQAKAQRVGQIEGSLLEGSSGWHGNGANAYRSLTDQFREDMRTTSEAFIQVAGALNVLAMQLDQVNQMYQQAEQLEWQIRSLDSSYWGADEQQRDSIRHEISRLQERHSSLLHQAQIHERQANNAANTAFDQTGAMVNRLFFHPSGAGGLKEPATTALDEVGHFFGKLWGKAKDVAHDAEQKFEEFSKEVADFAEGFSSVYLYNKSMGLADPLHEDFPEDRSFSYRLGRVGADVYSILEGTGEMFAGGMLSISGGAEAVVTSETIVLPAIGVGAAVAGGALATAGYKQFDTATKQLGKDWALFKQKGEETSTHGGTSEVPPLHGDAEPQSGTLSNIDARKWYLEQEKKIPELVDPNLSLKQRAMKAFELRNQFRTKARELMADRETAERLMRDEPNFSLNDLIERKKAKGLTEDEIWQDIWDSSMRSRTSVNRALGLE